MFTASPGLAERTLLTFRPENLTTAGSLIFGGLVPKSKAFRRHLAAAGVAKQDSQGKVVDFHSFRHTFCTNLHLAGVPLREAMELMRHSDSAVDDEHLCRLVTVRAASGD